MNKLLQKAFDGLLSDNTRGMVEKVILIVALTSFFVHLALIYLLKLEVFTLSSIPELLRSPISSVYTPFSFILIYEVYLLIYYLPKSFTIYIIKQYEIITLIIIRKLFKDLSALELSSNWFDIKGDLQFTYDIIASLVLFFLIYLFQQQGKKKLIEAGTIQDRVQNFILKKKMIAVFLVPLFFVMAVYTLVNWTAGISLNNEQVPAFKSINNLFFDQFFTILILVDVVLLLVSFFYTHQFHKIIRNSGFVISTILIRMSFGVDGLISTILIVFAVLFGLAILRIHNLYEKSSVTNEI